MTWTRHGVDAAAYARLDNLAKFFPRRNLKYVLEHPRQTTQSAAGSPSLGQVGPGAVSAFKWSAKDNTGKWIPQGITGSAAAQADGLIGGHRSLLVSWYQDTASSPARISFVNADSLDGATYNSATLVIPSGRTVRPIKTHAGGIAWYKHYLFRRRDPCRRAGLRHQLHPRRQEAPADRGSQRALRAAAGFGFYQQVKGQGCTHRSCSVETDRSAPALITGKYQDKKHNRRIVRWPLDADSGLPAVHGLGAWKMPASNVQGGLMHNGRLLAASSYDPKASGGIGELVSGVPDQPGGALPLARRRRGPPLRGHEQRRLLADGEERRPDRVRDRWRLSRPYPLGSGDVTAIAILLGLAIGMVVGAVGGGGAILALPVLIYVLDEPVGPASTASLVVVSLAAAIGAGSLARHGRVCWRLAFTFAAPAAFGSLFGTFANRAVGASALVLAFVPVMLIAAIATWRRTGRTPTTRAARTRRSPACSSPVWASAC